MGTDFDARSLVRIERRLAGLSRRVVSGSGERRAAVVVPFLELAGAPAVLFTVRSQEVATHKGQVSFPGGMEDPGDEGPVGTALRELEEELGVRQSHVRVLGLAHDAVAITGVPVTPVVGYLGSWPDLGHLQPSAAEIEMVFALTFSELLDPAQCEIREHARGRFPVFTAGPAPVWGLTAYILGEILRDVFDVSIGLTR